MSDNVVFKVGDMVILKEQYHNEYTGVYPYALKGFRVEGVLNDCVYPKNLDHQWPRYMLRLLKPKARRPSKLPEWF